MRVVAFNGSPRLIGNTSMALNVVLDELEKEGIETEQVQLFSSELIPCNACMSCSLRGDGRCINENDALNDYIDMILDADGVVLASPVYFGSVTSQMKLFMERVGLSSKYCNNQMRRKVGAALAVQARHGGQQTLSEMLGFFLDSQMVICPSSGVMVINGEKPSEVYDDKEGMKLLQDQGREMAWLLHRLHGGND